VTRHRQRSVGHVAFVLDCGEARGAELLAAHGWDEPAAINAHHAAAAAAAAAGAPARAAPPAAAAVPAPAGGAAPALAPQCIVCFEEMPPAAQRLVQLPCGHATCAACWKARPPLPEGVQVAGARRAPCPAVRRHPCPVHQDASSGLGRYPRGGRLRAPRPAASLDQRAQSCAAPALTAAARRAAQGILRARLDDGDVGRAACPALGCSAPLPASAAAALLGREDALRWERLLAQAYVDANPRLRWCGRPARRAPG